MKKIAPKKSKKKKGTVFVLVSLSVCKNVIAVGASSAAMHSNGRVLQRYRTTAWYFSSRNNSGKQIHSIKLTIVTIRTPSYTVL